MQPQVQHARTLYRDGYVDGLRSTLHDDCLVIVDLDEGTRIEVGERERVQVGKIPLNDLSVESIVGAHVKKITTPLVGGVEHLLYEDGKQTHVVLEVALKGHAIAIERAGWKWRKIRIGGTRHDAVGYLKLLGKVEQDGPLIGLLGYVGGGEEGEGILC